MHACTNHELLCIQVVTFEDWLKIDREEVARGQAQGKPRDKVVSIQEMLEIARS
jgi:hypothetical protein